MVDPAIELPMALIASTPSNAVAQTPNPTYHWENVVAPGDPYPSGAVSVIVEGAGLEQGSCDDGSTYDIASVVNAVNVFISHYEPVFFEVSPQDQCADATDYESATNSVMNGIFHDNTAAQLSSYFEGVQMDEEEGWFAYYTFEDINTDVLYNIVTDEVNKGVYTVNFMVQGFVAGTVTDDGTVCTGTDWTQAEYDDIAYGVVSAPQVSTACMAKLANGSYNDYSVDYNVVTWETTDSYPFNSLSYALDHTTGTPWTDPVSGVYVYNLFNA